VSLTTVATNLIAQFGYGGVAAGLFINALGIPIPSEIILPLAGVGVRDGSLHALPLLIVAVVAQLAALCITYGIARYGGIELVERYGKYVLIRRRELEKAEVAFSKYGGRLVLFGLCMPAIHGYVGYPAGIGKMRFGRFVVFALLGSTAWTVILGSLGYFLGGHLATINTVLHQFALVIAIIIVAVIVWWIVRQRRKPRRETTPNNPV